MKRLLLFVLAFPLFSSAGLDSDVKKVEGDLRACISVAESTMAIKICQNEGIVQLEKMMADLYNKTVQGLKTPAADPQDNQFRLETLRRLEASQRAWLVFRDANAELAGIWSLGGTQEAVEKLDARFEMTKIRLLELDKLFR